MNNGKQILMVVQRALRGVEDLSTSERASLYEAVAELLPEEQAEAARLTAFLIRESEGQQLKFRELLTQPTPAPVTPTLAADQRRPFSPAD